MLVSATIVDCNIRVIINTHIESQSMEVNGWDLKFSSKAIVFRF